MEASHKKHPPHIKVGKDVEEEEDRGNWQKLKIGRITKQQLPVSYVRLSWTQIGTKLANTGDHGINGQNIRQEYRGKKHMMRTAVFDEMKTLAVLTLQKKMTSQFALQTFP